MSLGLGEVESLLGELVAIGLVVLAQLPQCEVDLLEGVPERVFQDGLFDLLQLTEKLNEHLLAVLLACHFV